MKKKQFYQSGFITFFELQLSEVVPTAVFADLHT